MGQAASKATEAVAKRAAAASPRVSQSAQAQQTRAAAEAEWNKSVAAATGNGSGGKDFDYNPTRGEQHSRDISGEAMPEMPADLINFLNDAGPLERTIDKELTSSKVYDILVKDEKARDEQAKEANLRVRRKMPIMASFGDDPQATDGSMTERSTNFSTRDRSAIPTRLGITREDLFRLSDRVNGLKSEGPEWKKLMEAEYASIRKNGSKSKNFEDLKDFALFENSLRYIGVPVLMIDTEGDIIGVWSKKAEEMKDSIGLKLVPEESVQFSMLTEGK